MSLFVLFIVNAMHSWTRSAVLRSRLRIGFTYHALVYSLYTKNQMRSIFAQNIFGQFFLRIFMLKNFKTCDKKQSLFMTRPYNRGFVLLLQLGARRLPTATRHKDQHGNLKNNFRHLMCTQAGEREWRGGDTVCRSAA